MNLDRTEEDRLIRLFAALAKAFAGAPTTTQAFTNWKTRQTLIGNGLSQLTTALSEAFVPDPVEVRAALVGVILFNPECVPAQFTSAEANPHYDAKDFRRKATREELEADSAAPFFTEGYLYNLLGKEDARTLLGRMKRLCNALGYDYYELFPPDPAEEDVTPR